MMSSYTGNRLTGGRGRRGYGGGRWLGLNLVVSGRGIADGLRGEGHACRGVGHRLDPVSYLPVAVRLILPIPVAVLLGHSCTE